MSASLALQKAIRARLATTAAVTALVPAASIFDASARPEAFPCVILGEDRQTPADSVVQRYIRVSTTLHVWTKEAGLTESKAIVAAIRKALNFTFPALDQARCLDLRWTGDRYLRDPDGETAHGVITFEAVIEELA
jgi:hypothetical protein